MAHDELSAKILEDPSDDASWRVYLDWLQTRGDPRGALGAVQLALERATEAERPALQAQERALLDAHPQLVPAALAAVREAHQQRPPRDPWDRVHWEVERITLDWYAGFIVSARVGRFGYEEPGPSHAELVEEIVHHPSARFLREIVFGPLGAHPYSYRASVEALASGTLAALRKLHVADFLPEHSELSWTDLGSLGALWARYPRLEHVVIHGGDFELGALDLPEARSFAVRTGGLSRADLQSVVDASWPSLTDLELWFGDVEYGAETTIDDLAPILDGAFAPQLHRLGLMNADFTDEICARIGRSPIAARLTRLDLSLGTMGDDGARALASAGRAAFPRLVELDVEDNYLSEEAGARLGAAFPGVRLVFGRQDEPEDDAGARFVSVVE